MTYTFISQRALLSLEAVLCVTLPPIIDMKTNSMNSSSVHKLMSSLLGLVQHLFFHNHAHCSTNNYLVLGSDCRMLKFLPCWSHATPVALNIDGSLSRWTVSNSSFSTGPAKMKASSEPEGGGEEAGGGRVGGGD